MSNQALEEFAKEIIALINDEEFANKPIDTFIKGLSLLPGDCPWTTMGHGVAVLGLQLLFNAQAAWLNHFLLGHDKPSELVTDYGTFDIKDYEAFGIWSKARLDLTQAIFPFLDPVIQQLFVSPQNLWYWIEQAVARKRLKGMGLLEAPATTDKKSQRIKVWTDSLKEREDETQNIEFYNPFEFLSNEAMLLRFLEELDKFLEGQVIELIKAGNGKFEDSYAQYISSCRKAKNKIRITQSIQVGYCLDGELYVTAKNVRNPKPFA
jgi:hypothetical protein